MKNFHHYSHQSPFCQNRGALLWLMVKEERPGRWTLSILSNKWQSRWLAKRERERKSPRMKMSPFIFALHLSVRKALRQKLIWYKFFFLSRKQTTCDLATDPASEYFLWIILSKASLAMDHLLLIKCQGFHNVSIGISCIITYFYNETL